jgi:uridine phosphorylase
MTDVPPILNNKHYDQPSVFKAANLLREARRQKRLANLPVPAICILDPDGDFAQYVIAQKGAQRHPAWACYHTQLYTFTEDETIYGVIPYAVGASFAVLVAEELFACGCQLLISITSAGQVTAIAQPPYFVLIERALRDEGTSYHYLPPSPYSTLSEKWCHLLENAFAESLIRVLRGATWTTDAPFRETEATITYAQKQNILGVEMEAAALYAFAEAAGCDVVCFAHITNQMAQIDGDFEKGVDEGSLDALAIIHAVAHKYATQSTSSAYRPHTATEG